MKKGSVTPFCAMVLMLVSSLILVLLESARVYGLDYYATLKADTAIDSVCGEYQPYLWQQYGLLFLDGAYGSEQFSTGYVMERMENYMDWNCDATEGMEEWLGLDVFAMARGEVLLGGYALATDDEGELFLNYVAEREKEKLPLSVAEELYREFQYANQLEKKHGNVEASIEMAKETIVELKKEWVARWDEAEEAHEEEVKPVMPDTSGVDEVLNGAASMKSRGILNMVFTDLSKISSQPSKPRSDLQTRTKETGTMYLKMENEWYRKMLILHYLEEYFANYVHPIEKHHLKYETEYVICGKNSEEQNLAGALERIMLVREAANMTYLLRDKEKMAFAEGLASLIGLLAGENPGVIKMAQMGIIGAWAYMESLLDVRTLVSGGVIPLVKQKDEWTTTLPNFFLAFDGNSKAKECEKGLTYTDYLKQILFFSNDATLAYRMMEVMEMGMQSQEKYQNCQMQHMIAMLRFKVGFESKPIFSSLAMIGEIHREKYVFTKETERSYVP